MPLVRISLPEGLTTEIKTAVSKSVHNALMQEFHIPEHDYFHVIEEVKKENLIYPESYLGIDHTSSMIFIQITAAQGRTFEQKKALYAQIALNISSATIIKKEDILIVLLENNRENWSFGNGEVQNFTHI
jgi:phenylpyruvate tautomerase PptA (4-oxalocrotonate tautomerase family)